MFVNLYYEFNNTLLDFVFPEKSNLRCVLFGESPFRERFKFDFAQLYVGDVHTAAEKTDYGNRYLAAQPSEGASIQNSSGYASLAVMEPTAPEGYTLVFGPVSAANNAPGVSSLFSSASCSEYRTSSTWALRF